MNHLDGEPGWRTPSSFWEAPLSITRRPCEPESENTLKEYMHFPFLNSWDFSWLTQQMKLLAFQKRIVFFFSHFFKHQRVIPMLASSQLWISTILSTFAKKKKRRRMLELQTCRKQFEDLSLSVCYFTLIRVIYYFSYWLYFFLGKNQTFLILFSWIFLEYIFLNIISFCWIYFLNISWIFFFFRNF